jgi:hypothetical protein
MSDFPEMGGTWKFAPKASDSIRELRWKAESMLEYLRDNEAFLRKFPTGAADERIAMWSSLTALLSQASEDGRLADDARLEAQRVWAEEIHHSALFIVTMCVHVRSESARRRFAEDPEALEDLIDRMELGRPAAMHVLSKDDLNYLRQEGFLREGE